MAVVRAVKGRAVTVFGGSSGRADLINFSSFNQSNVAGPYVWDFANNTSAPIWNPTLSCAEFRDSSLMMLPVSTTPTTFPYPSLDTM